MSRTRLNPVSVSAILVAMTVVITWPPAFYLGTQVAAHNDPHFSMWRLGWIAHALPTDPGHLFDANIFYPELRTLAYSDATLLEGLVAAPFLWRIGRNSSPMGTIAIPSTRRNSSNCGGDTKKSWLNGPLMRYRLRPIDCRRAGRTKR